MTGVQEEHFLDACRHGRVENIQSFLESGIDINRTQNNYSLTASHIAAAKGHLFALELLCGQGAEINRTTARGWTPLHFACKRGRTESVQLLLNYGAGVHLAAKDGVRPLHVAAKRGHVDVMHVLLENAARVGDFTSNREENALHIAAKTGRCDVIGELLLYCNAADVNAVTVKGRTALYECSVRGYSRVVQQLLHHGACTRMTSAGHCDPLVAAIKHNHVDVVKTLLEHGSPVCQELFYPSVPALGAPQPIHLAVVSSKCDTASFDVLLTHGADIEARVTMKVVVDKGDFAYNKPHLYHVTALHLAVVCGRADLVEALCVAGCDVNSPYHLGGTESHTALYLAVKSRQLNICEVLLQHRASQENAASVRQSDCLSVALRYGNFALVKTLLKHGADVRGVLNQMSLTHWAVTFTRPDILHLLLSYDSPMNTLSQSKQTPLQHALDRSHYGTAVTLIRHGAKLHVTNSRPWGHTLNIRKIFDVSDSSYHIFGALFDSGIEVSLLMKTFLFILKDLSWLSYLEERPHMTWYLRSYVLGPRTLRQLCRSFVRRAVIKAHPDTSIWKRLYALPLPVPLIEYLTLREFERSCTTEGEQDYKSGY